MLLFGCVLGRKSETLKAPELWTWAELRHKFVLTPEEKRVIGFVIAAFLLGLVTKCYRDSRPLTPAKIEKKHALRDSFSATDTAGFRAASKPTRSTNGSRH
jgi:hypothetical protein